MKKIFFLLFILVFSVQSCRNMYVKIYDKSEIGKIDCLKVEGNDMFFNSKVENILTKNGIHIEENCPYTLKVYYIKLSQCNAPEGKSIGADFDGYLRFTVYKNHKLVYRAQEDYKGEFGDFLIEDLVKRMKKDLQIK